MKFYLFLLAQKLYHEIKFHTVIKFYFSLGFIKKSKFRDFFFPDKKISSTIELVCFPHHCSKL